MKLRDQRAAARPIWEKNFGMTVAQKTTPGMIIIEAVPITDFHDGPAMQRPSQKNTLGCAWGWSRLRSFRGTPSYKEGHVSEVPSPLHPSNPRKRASSAEEPQWGQPAGMGRLPLTSLLDTRGNWSNPLSRFDMLAFQTLPMSGYLSFNAYSNEGNDPLPFSASKM